MATLARWGARPHRDPCYARRVIDAEYWARYYEVTVERPAWETVRLAIGRFAGEADEAAGAMTVLGAGTGPELDAGGRDRFAVDLGCGAGRDTRELLRAGWRVLAIDREPAAIAMLEAVTPAEHRSRLATQVADLSDVEIPSCDLVNANLSLPFVAPEPFARTWGRILAALPAGGRVAAMLFGDRDGDAGDPTMTHPSPDVVRASLAAFEIEHWVDREEDGQTALGEPHHFHMLELVARRTA
jgi:tellurite methyltransferase